MSNVALRYGDAGRGEFEERPTTFPDLQRRLEEIRAEYTPRLGMPYSVDLVREGVGRMSVGLGDGEWMLFFSGSDGSRQLNSLGDEGAEGEVSFYFGDSTLLSRKYLVPRSRAIEVVRAWFEDGALSDVIRWTDKIF